MTNSKKPKLTKQVIVIVGGYGSGKSEVSVNLARYLLLNQEDTENISIADLDIVNPYFRSREAGEQLDKLGIKSIIPIGEKFHADLPIILPQIKGAIQNPQGKLILDVGGDDAGARVLSSLGSAFDKDTYDLLLVLNARRPFTADVDGSCEVIRSIEESSRLKFTGIIANTHLMENTTPEIIYEGLDLAQDVSNKTGLPIKFVSVVEEMVEYLDLDKIDVPIVTLNRSLLKPWE
jgi:hypothetical protein